MESRSNIHQRSNRLFQKFLEGTISPAEKEELFALAEHDAFLQDAIEGLSEKGDHRANVNQIKSTLAGKAKRKSGSLTTWSAAAGFLLLLGFSAWLMFRTADNPSQALESPRIEKEESLPSNEEEFNEYEIGIQPESTPADRDELIAGESIEIGQANDQEQTSRSNSLERRAETHADEAEDNLERKSQSAQIADNAAPQQSGEDDNVGLSISGYGSQGVVEEPAQTAEDNDSLPAGLSGDLISEAQKSVPPRYGNTYLPGSDVQAQPLLIDGVGLIIDQSSQKPVSLAEINVEGSEEVQYSNAEGQFAIPADKDSTFVHISAIGYQDQVINLRRDEPAIILLEQVRSQAAGENLAAGKSAKVTADNISKASAVPSIGWDAYQRYIAQNKKMPGAAGSAGISGSVNLEITIGRNGKVAGVKVLQSLGYGCDEEARRLILEGPGWILLDDKNRAVVEYSIDFP